MDDDADDEDEGEVVGRTRRRASAQPPAPAEEDSSEEEAEEADADRCGEEDEEGGKDPEDDEVYVDDGEDMRFVKAHGESATDEITGDFLSPRHVVWRSPDGSSVMRFNLSTLRKVAARAGGWRAPPHFRAAMEEELCSQAGGGGC